MKTEIQRTMRKIRRLNQRGLVRRASYSDKIRYLQMQVEAEHVLGSIEHMEPFGFTSHPEAGAQGIVLAFNGNGSHSVVFCVGDRRYRLQISEGEVAIYNRHGDKVHIKDNREIDVTAALAVNINTPDIYCSGNLTAQGTIQGDVVRNDEGTVLGTHTHPGDSGGTTGAPN